MSVETVMSIVEHVMLIAWTMHYINRFDLWNCDLYASQDIINWFFLMLPLKQSGPQAALLIAQMYNLLFLCGEACDPLRTHLCTTTASHRYTVKSCRPPRVRDDDVQKHVYLMPHWFSDTYREYYTEPLSSSPSPCTLTFSHADDRFLYLCGTHGDGWVEDLLVSWS